MQQDLSVAKTLGDIAGECRAHGNLGSAYFSKGSYKEALTAHRYQLVLAMKCKDTQAAAAALTSLGEWLRSLQAYTRTILELGCDHILPVSCQFIINHHIIKLKELSA
jgi:hypothetical protein